MKILPKRSEGEEIVNAYTHLVWAILSFMFLAIFLIDEHTSLKNKISSLFMMGISGWTFFSSYLYHSTKEKKKRRNREVDKTAIFLMITGTGVSLNLSCENQLLSLLGSSISIVLGCILLAAYVYKKHPTEAFSITSYIALGCFCVLPIVGVFGENLYEHSSSSWLVIAGIISYCLGILFYARDSIEWNHTKWHIFVMIGFLFHAIGHYRSISF